MTPVPPTPGSAPAGSDGVAESPALDRSAAAAGVDAGSGVPAGSAASAGSSALAGALALDGSGAVAGSGVAAAAGVLDAPVEASLPGGWQVRRLRSDAGWLHGLTVPEGTGREVWVLEAVRPALVLGSTQAESLVDAEVAAELGVDVVRRRSGGGAVLVVPDDTLWVDVVLPAGDPLWEADVARAAVWLGDTWTAALADLGIAPTVAHRGALACGRLGRLVCFASLGSGEVTQDGRKLVGISQRRTRGSARFQCGLYRVWDPSSLVRLLRLDPDGAADVATAALGTGRPGAEVLSAFLARLPP